MSYRKAAARLEASGFPLEEMTALLQTQAEREARAASFHDVAEPTARATEMVFSHGATELASIGRRFGHLIYTLDAWEDRAKDRKSGDFNALLAFPAVDGRAEMLSAVASLEQDLPTNLALRLRMNVEERLGMRLRVVHCACKKSARARWASAVELARSMKERERAGLFKGAAVLATVSVLAFFAPHQIRSAESWRQCLGLTVNLMAVGAVFANVQIPDQPVKKTGCWNSCGNCCCCDACDCGDCCECGSCCDC